MNCKNCNGQLSIDTAFCERCGAKIVQGRITFKNLRKDIVTNYLGWDNKFFYTTKNLILRPGRTIQEYLGGTRKKYMNPFGYFGLIVTISFLIFSQFEDNFIAMTAMGSDGAAAESAFEIGYELHGEELTEDQKKIKEVQRAYGDSVANAGKSILKYFSIFSFILLPFYGFIAYLVYGKKYNYGEHLVIGTYIQAILGILSFIIFLLVFVFSPKINILSLLGTILFYTYVYRQLYNQSIKQTILSFLKFIGIILVGFIAIVILSLIVAFAFRALTG